VTARLGPAIAEHHRTEPVLARLLPGLVFDGELVAFRDGQQDVPGSARWCRREECGCPVSPVSLPGS
jgi:hypothetical protein